MDSRNGECAAPVVSLDSVKLEGSASLHAETIKMRRLVHARTLAERLPTRMHAAWFLLCAALPPPAPYTPPPFMPY